MCLATKEYHTHAHLEKKEHKNKYVSINGNKLGIICDIKILQKYCNHPPGIVVSDADCCAVELGSNPGEGKVVCKYIVLSRHGGTPDCRRAASLLGRLVEGDERSEIPDHPHGVLSQNWGGIEPNRTVTCIVFKATS
ncbi:uncharacterized protein TNCV_3569951 [Trichonephila clavipes]|nr:uncharacterized protein TNCV_3569951 [Trichonephila clavipes]